MICSHMPNEKSANSNEASETVIVTSIYDLMDDVELDESFDGIYDLSGSKIIDEQGDIIYPTRGLVKTEKGYRLVLDANEVVDELVW